jgi:hypothetical protein
MVKDIETKVAELEKEVMLLKKTSPDKQDGYDGK